MSSKSQTNPSVNQPSPSQPHPYSHPQFVTAYGPHLRSQLVFTQPDMAKQSFKDECDINLIMRNYAATGQIDHVNKRPLMWGDAPDVDFQAAMAVVVEARERFADLPATVRDRFSNDPQRLLEFLQDDSNRAEAEKLGLVRPVPGSARADTPPVEDSTTPPKAA